MTPDVGNPDDRTVHSSSAGIGGPHDDAPADPWSRVLGIVVLGSFVAVAKTARGPRRNARRGPATTVRPEAAA